MAYIEDGGQTVATHNAAAIVCAYAGECVCAYVYTSVCTKYQTLMG